MTVPEPARYIEDLFRHTQYDCRCEPDARYSRHDQKRDRYRRIVGIGPATYYQPLMTLKNDIPENGLEFSQDRFEHWPSKPYSFCLQRWTAHGSIYKECDHDECNELGEYPV